MSRPHFEALAAAFDNLDARLQVPQAPVDAIESRTHLYSEFREIVLDRSDVALELANIALEVANIALEAANVAL